MFRLFLVWMVGSALGGKAWAQTHAFPAGFAFSALPFTLSLCLSSTLLAVDAAAYASYRSPLLALNALLGTVFASKARRRLYVMSAGRGIS